MNQNPPMFQKYKIRLNSGIGDCLRSISRQAYLSSHINNLEAKFFWTYGVESDAGWSQLLRDDIFGRNKAFEYVSRDDFIHLDLPELFSGSYGNLLLPKIDNKAPQQGFSLTLNSDEIKLFDSLNMMSANLNIGLQLSGNDKLKHWPIKSYIELINFFHHNYKNSHIYILDSPSKLFPDKGYDTTKVTNLIGKSSISVNIELIQKMDLWISPDSFSKYVANWSNVSQILLCCRLPYIEPEKMIKSCFEEVGIYNNSLNQIVGIDFDNRGRITSITEDISLIPFDAVKNAFYYLENNNNFSKL